MSTSDDPFADGDNPERGARLRNGRYYYACPGEEHTGRERAHTRITTFIKPAGDSYALDLYNQRKVIEGFDADEVLALVASNLVAAFQAAQMACDADPCDATRKGLQRAKRDLDALARDAHKAARADAGARRGTAYHGFTERLDRAGVMPHLPARARERVVRYREVLDAHGLEVIPEYIERRVHVAGHELIGTLDRIVLDRNTGELLVADLKTQRQLWTFDTMAIQLGLYANAEHIWDEELGTWEPMPEVSRELAVVIWMPETHPDGNDEVTIEDVRIDRAMHGADLCEGMRAWRREAKNFGARRPLRSPAERVL